MNRITTSLLANINLSLIKHYIKVAIHYGNNLFNDKRRITITIIAILSSTVILGYLLYSQWDLLVTHPWKLQPAFIAWAFLVYSLILLFNILTWSSIIGFFGSRLDFWTHFRSTCISALGKRLPGTFWYVVWRAQIYKDDTPAKVVTFASGIEMAVTVIAAAVICVFFAVPMIVRYQLSLLGLAAVVITSLFLLHPRMIQWILKRLKVETSSISYTNVLKWTGLLCIIWLLVGILLYLIGRIYIPIPPSDLGYFIGSTALTGILSRLLLFSPSLFGFGEVSLSLLLSNIMPSSFAVIIAISNRIIIIMFEIVWAFISLLLSRKSILSKE